MKLYERIRNGKMDFVNMFIEKWLKTLLATNNSEMVKDRSRRKARLFLADRPVSRASCCSPYLIFKISRILLAARRA